MKVIEVIELLYVPELLKLDYKGENENIVVMVGKYKKVVQKQSHKVKIKCEIME